MAEMVKAMDMTKLPDVTYEFWFMLNNPYSYGDVPAWTKNEKEADAAIDAFIASVDEGPRPVIISGGEVLELGPQKGGDDIPF